MKKILLIAILVVLAGGGYFVLSKNGTLPASLPGVQLIAPRATEKDFAFIEDSLIRKHFVAQANASAYRVKTNFSVGKMPETSVWEIEIKGSTANFHTTQTVNNKETSQMISMGDTTYIKDYSDSAWWKQTVKPGEKQKGKDSKELIEPKDIKEEYIKDAQKATYKMLGEEACGSLQCYKYEEVQPESSEGNRIFWFDKNKLLLRKEETGIGQFKGTNEYEYDGINITAPSPVKEVPEGKNIYEYLAPAAVGQPDGSSTPSQEEINDALKQFNQQSNDSEVPQPPEQTTSDESY